MKKIVLTVVTLATLALAEAPESYKACTSCHGSKGEKNTIVKDLIPANLAKADIEKALKGYKDGSYGGDKKMIMKSYATKLSDADIKALADYIGK